jgi:DNA-binding transcriptional LysR family regulator
MCPAEANTPLLVARLRAGQIDVAFIRPPIGDSDGLALELLDDEPTIMVLPTGHSLCRTASAPLSALADETFVLFARELNPANYDSIIAACGRAGFSPKLGQVAPQVLAIVPMVAAGLGVSIVPQSIGRIGTDGAVYLPIEGDAPRAFVSLAYRRDDRSAAVQNFVAVARKATRGAKDAERASVRQH